MQTPLAPTELFFGPCREVLLSLTPSTARSEAGVRYFFPCTFVVILLKMFRFVLRNFSSRVCSCNHLAWMPKNKKQTTNNNKKQKKTKKTHKPEARNFILSHMPANMKFIPWVMGLEIFPAHIHTAASSIFKNLSYLRQVAKALRALRCKKCMGKPLKVCPSGTALLTASWNSSLPQDTPMQRSSS